MNVMAMLGWRVSGVLLAAGAVLAAPARAQEAVVDAGLYR
jgi:hypothetical protein